MVKGVILFCLLFSVLSMLIFFGNKITKQDVFTSGKLTLAALASLAVSGIIYLSEMG